MTPVEPVRAVIFDMDGLLVDTAPVWRQVGNSAFAALGVDVAPFVETGAVMGLSMEDAMAAFRTYAGWAPTDHPELEAGIEAGVLAAIRAQLELKPGACEALDFCDEHGLRTAVASGSTTAIIEAVLARVGLRARFTAVCSSSDEPLGKPHPGVFLRAAAELGVPARQCVVVEDAVAGCIAAKAACMRVVAVPEGPAVGDPRLAIADAVLATLAELAGPAARAMLGLCGEVGLGVGVGGVGGAGGGVGGAGGGRASPVRSPAAAP